MGLHTRGQTSKVQGLQNAYMVVLFGTFGAKSLASLQEFGPLRASSHMGKLKLIGATKGVTNA